MNGAWLQGHLGAIATHLPAKFPKSPSELLKKSEPKKQMGAKDWQAFIFSVTGKKIDIPEQPDGAA